MSRLTTRYRHSRCQTGGTAFDVVLRDLGATRGEAANVCAVATVRERVVPIVKRAVTRLPLRWPGARFVFLYHDVSPPDAIQHHQLYSTPPELFERQIALLRRAVEFVPLAELTSCAPGWLARPQAAITFDDGMRSFVEHALPVLEAQGIPATLFVNRLAIEHDHLPFQTVIRSRAGNVALDYDQLDQLAGPEHAPDDGHRVFLTAEELRQLRSRDVEIGSHGATHRVLAGCDQPTREQEISGNARYLHETLRVRPAFFAIPYGKREHYDQATLEACRAAGHRMVFSSNPAAVSRTASTLWPRVAGDGLSIEMLRFIVNRAVIHRPAL